MFRRKENAQKLGLAVLFAGLTLLAFRVYGDPVFALMADRIPFCN